MLDKDQVQGIVNILVNTTDWKNTIRKVTEDFALTFEDWFCFYLLAKNGVVAIGVDQIKLLNRIRLFSEGEFGMDVDDFESELEKWIDSKVGRK